jgi:Spy/CpxP family protein refolding chaperone
MSVYSKAPSHSSAAHSNMDINKISFWLTVVGTICWGICFWWMHRLSVKQNRLLDRLTEQAKRIEKLSKIEHDLIKEVHPQVSEIKETMVEVIAAVKENTEASSPQAP